MTISAQAALASNELAERRGLGMVNIDRHTHPTKRSGRIPVTCAVCHRQFEARRRTARFCGTRCRKVAERRRGEPSKMDVTVNRRPSALAVGTRSPKSAERTSPRRCAASSAADVTLNHPVDIVPDAHWPNMWRFACGCHKKSIGRRDRN
jgi:hypothetical protein